MKMGGYVISKLSTCIIINPLCPHLSGPPQISHPPYLPNGDSVGEFYCTIGFRALENGGGKSLQNPKKKTQFWWEHPCNPKP